MSNNTSSDKPGFFATPVPGGRPGAVPGRHLEHGPDIDGRDPLSDSAPGRVPADQKIDLSSGGPLDTAEKLI